jgi:PAS domain S-box-containing protein
MSQSLATTLAQTLERKNNKLTELRVIVEACPLATFITDSQGECVYVNQAYQGLVGRSYQDALGDRWKRFVHPDDVDEVWQMWCESISRHEAFDHRYRYVRPDSTIIPVHCRAVRLPSGNYVGYSNATNGFNCAFECDARGAYMQAPAYA